MLCVFKCVCLCGDCCGSFEYKVSCKYAKFLLRCCLTSCLMFSPAAIVEVFLESRERCCFGKTGVECLSRICGKIAGAGLLFLSFFFQFFLSVFGGLPNKLKCAF